MSIKINTKANSKSKKKNKSDTKKLVLIFFGAFSVFFFICTFVGSIFTNSLDVPALKEGSSLNSVSSEDFKGRIDPRLRSIEMQEEGSPVTTSDTSMANQTNQTVSGSNAVTRDTNINIPNTDIDTDSTSMEEDMSGADFENTDEVPYNNNRQKTGSISGSQSKTTSNPFQPKSSKARTIVKPAVPASKPTGTLNLRNKVPVPMQMNKVTVDGFSSPTEAKRVSKELMNSNLNVAPFIKENNGSYSLQVGSFSSSQKANGLADELKKRNLPARVTQD